ncbi:MAG TPA: lipoprotein insertase outer membrane protein LolB [Burkholderiales bacterium]|jgi:outer membrane lipoprotein LolB
MLLVSRRASLFRRVLVNRFALLALVVLAGCATTQAPRAPLPQGAGAFSLEGRISVHYGEQNLSGKFTWDHTPATDDVGLASPLGTQMAQITRDEHGVTLTDSEQHKYRARDVESLTQTRLGWRMPLAGLTDWVHARPHGSQAKIERDSAGRPSILREDGWVIEYGYSGDGRAPQRLFLNYTLSEQPLDIRLAIDTRG